MQAGNLGSHISVLLVQQEIVGDSTPVLRAVLECDREREELLAKVNTHGVPPAELEAGALDPDEAQAMAPARILVVDDVSVNRELVKALLSIFGHRITEACNGADAVKTALNMPFDLILMDLQMPGMDGIAATHAIRTTSVANARTPIVALSANVMANHIDACRQAGMDDHIGKPMSPARLLEVIGHWSSQPRSEPTDAGLSLSA